ncbi:MAG: alcohol dehydrogenase (cytochrome c) [Kiritimatiellia bacterium]|jgi:alcohol dehydrogenase (cytochrome c)
MKHLTLLVLLVCALPIQLMAQDGVVVSPDELLNDLDGDWRSYSGDYSGKRYSSLTQINKDTVKNLTLAWTTEMNFTTRGEPRDGFNRFAGSSQLVTQIGGEGRGDIDITSGSLKGSILEVNGILYVTSPDHAWAMDARDGSEIWHYHWETLGGTHIGSRGSAIWNDSLLFETPDNFLVSVNIHTGEENWHSEIASFELQYFSTMAPIVVGDRVIVGTGNDLDQPGFTQAFDAGTGELLWKFYSVPMNEGDPGLDTWPSLDAASHGGGNAWVPGVYDPETDLYIFGTGNPTPAYTGVSRPGDNLFTCSLVAVNVTTGEMEWYFQTSPHDTHDWDSAQTPILIDGMIDGQPRKLVSTASRNGYFFTVDRVTGEHIATNLYSTTANWSLGVRQSGSPEPNPIKDATIAGSLVSPVEGGVANWQPPAFNPDTGLFYTQENNGYNMLYLTDPDPRGSMGLGGKQRDEIGDVDSAFQAIDYQTGKAVWRHEWPGGDGVAAGVLTTASGLVFTGDGRNNMVAFDAGNGDLLWHTRIGNMTNPPQTFLVDGKQYLLVAVRDRLFSFVMY